MIPVLSPRAKSSPNPTARRRCAFTLIELLVVIAIISLLVSILVPSLTKAKELAKRAVCASHLRAIGVSASLYAQENSGYFPSVGPRVGNSNYDWAAAYRPTRVGRFTQSAWRKGYWGNLGLLFIHGFLDTPEVLYSPSDPVDEEKLALWIESPSKDDVHAGYSYRMWKSFDPDDLQTGDYGSDGLWLNTSDVSTKKDPGKSLSSLSLIADRCTNSGAWYGRDDTCHGMFEGYHACYADGHAGWIADPEGWLWGENGGQNDWYYMANAFRVCFDNGYAPKPKED
ncbi:MAG: type II secretion system protein [Phycisphaerae bacterium]|nr:type II secretion system protein [Phycisphaerae bacterium]